MERKIILARATLNNDEDDEISRILKQLQSESANITITEGTVQVGDIMGQGGISNSRSTPLPREKVFTEEEEEINRILNQLKNEVNNITVRHGTVQTTTETGSNGANNTRSTLLAREKVYYWYNAIGKDGSERGKQSLQFEISMLEKFKNEQGPENFWYKAQFRTDGRLEVIFILRYRITRYSPYQQWTFQMIYGDNYGEAQDVSAHGLNAEFGGAIQVYPIDPAPSKLTRNGRMFHHLVHEGSTDRYFLCRMRTAATDESARGGGSQLHAYKALQNVLRWLTVYNIWQKTGRDVDAE